jgi:hypothetical protein
MMPMKVSFEGSHIQWGPPASMRARSAVVGNGEIVHHRAVRRFEPFLADQLAILVRHAVRNISRGKTARLIAEEIQLSSIRIGARMRGHCLAAQLPAIVPLAQRLQGIRVDLHCAAVLFQRQQPATVKDRRGVVYVSGLTLHAGVVGIGIAVHTVE